ncbi:MAG: hypothetical protein KC583_04605 [Myxococcales bacterium]|nr:hypothetical protein [Myxococcales bacterium]
MRRGVPWVGFVGLLAACEPVTSEPVPSPDAARPTTSALDEPGPRDWANAIIARNLFESDRAARLVRHDWPEDVETLPRSTDPEAEGCPAWGVTRVDTHTFRVDQAALARHGGVVGNCIGWRPNVIGCVRTTPVYRNGAFVAYRMMSVRRCGPGYALGLRGGDALLAIGERPRTSWSVNDNIWLNVACAVYYATDTLRVTILRRGEEMTLTYLLAPTDDPDAGPPP